MTDLWRRPPFIHTWGNLVETLKLNCKSKRNDFHISHLWTGLIQRLYVTLGKTKPCLTNKHENTYFKSTCKSYNLHISDALITTLNIRADFPQKAFFKGILNPRTEGKVATLVFWDYMLKSANSKNAEYVYKQNRGGTKLARIHLLHNNMTGHGREKQCLLKTVWFWQSYKIIYRSHWTTWI